MVNLFVCGDVINYECRDGAICSDKLAQLVISADFSVCNFEAPIEGYGTAQPKSGTHHFQRPETITGLKKQGFDLLLLANNHIMDFGEEGLAATIDHAKEAGVETIGAGLNAKAAYAPIIKEFDSLKIGIINACEAQFGVIDYFERPHNAGYAWVNHSQIDKNIILLKRECDFVIIFSHAGLEHYSIPQKEWRERYRHFCSLGADVVIGSHPHVPQGYEKQGESLIFYSLGNFYFDSKSYKDRDDSSFAVWLKIERDNPPVFKPVFYYKKKGLVRLAPPEKQVDIDGLCASLSDSYKKAHDQMCLEAYEQFKRNLIFSLMPLSYDGNLSSSLRRIASRILGRSKRIDKTLLQLHLFRNEAYYYAAKHALELQASKRYKRL